MSEKMKLIRIFLLTGFFYAIIGQTCLSAAIDYKEDSDGIIYIKRKKCHYMGLAKCRAELVELPYDDVLGLADRILTYIDGQFQTNSFKDLYLHYLLIIDAAQSIAFNYTGGDLVPSYYYENEHFDKLAREQGNIRRQDAGFYDKIQTFGTKLYCNILPLESYGDLRVSGIFGDFRTKCFYLLKEEKLKSKGISNIKHPEYGIEKADDLIDENSKRHLVHFLCDNFYTDWHDNFRQIIPLAHMKLDLKNTLYFIKFEEKALKSRDLAPLINLINRNEERVRSYIRDHQVAGFNILLI
jgi:hypothetical protein